jgi:hypothetical protein
VSEDYLRSAEHTFRRRVRETIRAARFTKSERDVALALVNHWFTYRHSGQPIHPGRAKIAKAAGVTVKTVSRTFDHFRRIGFLVAISNLKGGGEVATRYEVKIAALDAWVLSLTGTKKPGKAHYRGTFYPAKGGTKCPTVLDDGIVAKEDLSSRQIFHTHSGVRTVQ